MQKLKTKSKLSITIILLMKRCSIRRPHVHGTSTREALPTAQSRPAGTFVRELTENVRRFARESPDMLIKFVDARSKEVIIPQGAVNKNNHGMPVTQKA